MGSKENYTNARLAYVSENVRLFDLISADLKDMASVGGLEAIAVLKESIAKAKANSASLSIMLENERFVLRCEGHKFCVGCNRGDFELLPPEYLGCCPDECYL